MCMYEFLKQHSQRQHSEEYERYRAVRRLRNHSRRLFLEESGWVRFGPGYRVTSGKLYEHYQRWCLDQGVMPKTMRELCTYVSQNQEHYHIRSSTNIPVGNGKRLRGFLGMEVICPVEDTGEDH